MTPILIAAAIVDDARNDRPSAVARLQQLAGLRLGGSELIAYLPAVARVSKSAGELATIEELLGNESAHDPRYERFVTATRAVLSEATDDYDRAEPLYVRTAESCNAYGCVVERAHALIGLGRCHLRLGRDPDAKDQLEEAREIFSALGACVLVAEIDGLLAEIS